MIEQNLEPANGSNVGPSHATEILPGVFLGGMTDARNFDGIRLCVRDEGADYEEPHILVPMLIQGPPNHTAPYCISREALHRAATILKQKEREGRKIIVHCLHGRDRSPLVVAYWLVLTQKFATMDEAYAFIQEKRPIVVDRQDWLEPLPVEVTAGSPPIVTIQKSEQQKYIEMWDRPEYRAVAPGELCAMEFLEVARPKAGSEVIDFGTGTGRGALMLAIMGMKVKMLDFAPNCLDEDVRNALKTQAHVLSFDLVNLYKPFNHTSEYGYCTDVMEHIEPGWVTTVLMRILQASKHVFFQISCEEDQCGKLIGEKLHLTVQPMGWWIERLQKLGAVIHWSKDYKTHCMIYCSAWATGQDFIDNGIVNVTDEVIRRNVETNLAGPWRDIGPFQTNDMEVAILGGGPSLNDYADEIKQLKASGVKIVTLNGAYHWAREKGLWPVNQVVVDAREFNKRFVQPIDEGNYYFISSQCDPAVLEGLPVNRTFLWHTNVKLIEDLLNKYRPDLWFNTPGGSTVLLRAIPLLRMMGYKKFHLYGCDSCLVFDQHHAFSQPENDNAPVIPVIVQGKTFYCHPWMASQAQEFMDLIKFFGHEIEINVRGDGLLAWILESAAQLADGEVLTLA